MAGLLDLFRDDQFGLGTSRHSRKIPGNNNLEEKFVDYGVVGAAQNLHILITGTLPYKGTAAGPIIDSAGSGGSVADFLGNLGNQ